MFSLVLQQQQQKQQKREKKDGMNETHKWMEEKKTDKNKNKKENEHH